MQTLCRDVSCEVRANISFQLRFIAERLGDNVLKLLPFLVELINDEDSSVRQASVQTIGYFLPLIKSGKNTLAISSCKHILVRRRLVQTINANLL